MFDFIVFSRNCEPLKIHATSKPVDFEEGLCKSYEFCLWDVILIGTCKVY
jgi:hypothetical protein